MTPIEKQILKNQATIMAFLSSLNKEEYCQEIIKDRLIEIEELIHPKEIEEPCCEMPKRLASEKTVKGFFAKSKKNGEKDE